MSTTVQTWDELRQYRLGGKNGPVVSTTFTKPLIHGLCPYSADERQRIQSMPRTAAHDPATAIARNTALVDRDMVDGRHVSVFERCRAQS